MPTALAFLLFVSVFLLELHTFPYKDSAHGNIAQRAALYEFIPKILKKLAANANEQNVNDIYVDTVYTVEPKKEDGSDDAIFFHIAITPVADRPNINLLYANEKRSALWIAYLYKALQEKKVRNPSLFVNMVLDVLDKDDTERMPESEIAKELPVTEGKIVSYSQFQKIVSAYIRKTKDKKILDVPFKKLFSFFWPKTCFDLKNANEYAQNIFKKIAKNYTHSIEKECVKSYNTMQIYPVFVTVENASFIYDIKSKKVITFESSIY